MAETPRAQHRPGRKLHTVGESYFVETDDGQVQELDLFVRADGTVTARPKDTVDPGIDQAPTQRTLDPRLRGYDQV